MAPISSVGRLSNYLRVFGNRSKSNSRQTEDDFEDFDDENDDDEAVLRQEEQLIAERRNGRQATTKPRLSLHLGFDFVPQTNLDPSKPDEFDYLSEIIIPKRSAGIPLFGLDLGFSVVSRPSRGDPIEPRDLLWLENKLKEGCGEVEVLPGVSVPEFALRLVEMLKEKRDNPEVLQAELFDLLGCERIGLMEELLGCRDELVRSYQNNRKAMRSEMVWSAAAAGAMAAPKQPTYARQVTVQSAEEMALRKLIRKEEKRSYSKVASSSESTSNLAMLIAAHNVAAVKPLLDSGAGAGMASGSQASRRAQAEAKKLPFVFDSYAQAKSVAGFINGVKLSLPMIFARKDEKKFEEVHIPAVEQASADLGPAKLVPISSLDPEVGQVVFAGTKSLNRIQSVVFPSAYRTNENLLVCAPTGAGKTNVAMMCIAQTIRQHLDDVGNVRRDAFKIVYVAPMKALAAEMTANFGKRLAPLGLVVKELTGDMQLTKTEIMQTQMLVTTPEKWDVVTRKPGDVALSQLVRLLIIDEVHLLHGDRGPVIEALVARTLRMVESSQTVIRVVGLSATLPNYTDVAAFLKVNPYRGLFYFDGRFRPVPLAQTFIGVKADKMPAQLTDMEEICYDKVLDFVKKGHQVMVFVHARNATVKTGLRLLETARNRGQQAAFAPEESAQLGLAQKAMAKSRNKQLVELFNAGFGIHHAGMLRSDRSMVEKLFGQGLIKVLVCTATLAWGVNLPAHGVIIKGTEIYDAKRGSFVDVGILDVLQIFGRAGRPQFDTSGHGIIMTTHDKLSHYLSLLTNQFPIESNFIALIADNLNAEVALGTVTNVDEAVEWLSYTYLFVRMRKNPLVYGIKHQELMDDPLLDGKRRQIVMDAANRLDKVKMIRYDLRTGYLFPTDSGRIASHFYIKYETVELFEEKLRPVMNEGELLALISQAQEFEQLKVRDEELRELDGLTRECCELPVTGGAENVHGKVNILIQAHVSRGTVEAFSLISDQNYVITNACRIVRGLFEMVLKRNWPLLAGRLLRFAKTLERQTWDWESPLRQHPFLACRPELLYKIESRNFTVEKMREMDSKEIGHFIHHVRLGPEVKRAAFEFPFVEIEASIQPITRTVLRVRLQIRPDFRWNDRVHFGGAGEIFWVWVEDPDNNHIYHHEQVAMGKKQVIKGEAHELVFTIPIFEPLPSQYYARCISDRWLGCEAYCPISFKHLILPEQYPPHTDLLSLQPLPVTALKNVAFESLYRFSHFNPIQTQIFHSLYHSDTNVLLGAPTGSGKTIVAEIAMLKVFRDYPEAKVVYIAPLKALVRERMSDWKDRLEGRLGKTVVELTGDVSPDVAAIKRASVIVTTPEKWDGISRSWQTRGYVQAVRLIVIDEIHLLGEDRGPVLEVIVSRTNFISSHTSRSLRVIGLSTALANAMDLAEWLGISNPREGLFNFRPSVRPVPLEVHISGFAGKHYCPRMATMNKPTFQAIQTYSPEKPSIIFVSSRRQTRLTALDLIAYLALEDNPKMWLNTSEREIDEVIASVKDQNLKLTLAFGIGMHHAGLVEWDRKVVEELFVNQKIQILIATATVAWGVNFPAHLVIIKGTEFYDGKTRRYVDMPITDVLQMMGRAGRPQYDDHGIACVFVHDQKKHFYKKFLYEPFPVESSLLKVLPDHLNAEIVAGTIKTRRDALDYLTWTFFFRRLLRNPSYYGLEGVDETNINTFLTDVVNRTVQTLYMSRCVEISGPDGEEGQGQGDDHLEATTLGRIASFYYLSHETLSDFSRSLTASISLEEVLGVLCDAEEFAELPVRHNEDLLNAELAKQCRFNIADKMMMESPHTKTHLLLQSHFSRLDLPCSDYYTDLKSVLDQAIRVLQAMIDICAEAGWLAATLHVQLLLQMVVQGRWADESSLLCLPVLEKRDLPLIGRIVGVSGCCLPGLIAYCGEKYEKLSKLLAPAGIEEYQIEDVFKVLEGLPMLQIKNPQLREQLDEDPSEAAVGGGTTGASIPLNLGADDKKGWVKVKPDTCYALCVELINLAKGSRSANSSSSRAFAPKFPRPKDENWFLMLGNADQRELVALKRVGGGVSPRDQRSAKRHHQLTFYTPPVGSGGDRLILTLYVVSDSYIGLDQQYEVRMEVSAS